MKRLVLAALWLVFAAISFAREVPITILATADLHGHLLPTADYDGHTNLGGLARCATTIREIRSQTKNCLLIDAGDTLQGTAVGYLSDGRVMVKALNALRYDAWVWGNHEFDWGLSKLASCATQAAMPILNANLQAAGEKSDEARRILERVQPFRVVECDGVKVGIIGLNTPGIPQWSRPRLIAGLKFADSVETLKAVLPAAKRAGAQVLVLVCHQGYREWGDDFASQVNAIARNFPELDVIVGAHTHRNLPESKLDNILYCQPQYFGIGLGRVDLVYDTARGRVVRRQSQSISMDVRVPLDPELLKVCGAEIDRAEKTLGTVIGEATADFDGRGAPKHETSVHDLFFESIATALRARDVKVDVIIHGVLEPKEALKRGPITVGDVWRLAPYENSIGVMQLTPVQLREVLQENAAAYNKREFRGLWGLNWTFDPSLAGTNSLITLNRKGGVPLRENERLAVAFNSYELAGGGLRWKKLCVLADDPSTKLVEYDLQTRQALIDFITSRQQISPVVQNWWRAVHSGNPDR